MLLLPDLVRKGLILLRGGRGGANKAVVPHKGGKVECGRALYSPNMFFSYFHFILSLSLLMYEPGWTSYMALTPPLTSVPTQTPTTQPTEVDTSTNHLRSCIIHQQPNSGPFFSHAAAHNGRADHHAELPSDGFSFPIAELSPLYGTYLSSIHHAQLPSVVFALYGTYLSSLQVSVFQADTQALAGAFFQTDNTAHHDATNKNADGPTNCVADDRSPLERSYDQVSTHHGCT